MSYPYSVFFLFPQKFSHFLKLIGFSNIAKLWDSGTSLKSLSLACKLANSFWILFFLTKRGQCKQTPNNNIALYFLILQVYFIHYMPPDTSGDTFTIFCYCIMLIVIFQAYKTVSLISTFWPSSQCLQIFFFFKETSIFYNEWQEEDGKHISSTYKRAKEELIGEERIKVQWAGNLGKKIWSGENRLYSVG